MMPHGKPLEKIPHFQGLTHIYKKYSFVRLSIKYIAFLREKSNYLTFVNKLNLTNHKLFES